MNITNAAEKFKKKYHLRDKEPRKLEISFRERKRLTQSSTENEYSEWIALATGTCITTVTRETCQLWLKSDES